MRAMEIDEFVDQLEMYYGKYPEKLERVKVMVKAYLKDFKKDRLSLLLKLVMMNHAVNYGCPDMAAIEKAYDYALRNNKCQDMKVLPPTNYKIEDAPTEEELAETKRLIDSGEGQRLTEMFSKKVKQMSKDLND